MKLLPESENSLGRSALVILGVVVVFIFLLVRSSGALRHPDLAFALHVALVAAPIVAAIGTYRMRRRIRKNLGRDATEADFTSLNTWMKVEEVERRQKDNKPIG
jgi:O-antigen/teichoic acid export membrane protein